MTLCHPCRLYCFCGYPYDLALPSPPSGFLHCFRRRGNPRHLSSSASCFYPYDLALSSPPSCYLHCLRRRGNPRHLSSSASSLCLFCVWDRPSDLPSPPCLRHFLSAMV